MSRASALELAARELEREARNLRLQAREARETRDRLKTLKRAQAIILRKLRDHPEALQTGAIQDLAREYQLPPETIAAQVATAIRNEKAAARRSRDRLICRKARAGMTNAEIAGHHHLHPKTVQRIIARDLMALFRHLDRDDREADD